MNRILRPLIVLAVLVGLTWPAGAQTTLTSTTLAVAMTAASTTAVLASATGVVVGRRLYIDGELMQVTALTGVTATVRRGLAQGATPATAHRLGDLVWVNSAAGDGFKSFNVVGGCTASALPYLPHINTESGRSWDCPSSGLWTERVPSLRTFVNGAKVGTSAGWVLGAANNLPYVATMAASQTGGTLVMPLTGLSVGSMLTGFRVVAQVESAGGTVTIDAALRAVTNVAADPTDALIGSGMTQVSVTADTAVSSEKTGLAEVVTSGKSYYLLITATTAASTDIILLHSEVTTR